MNPRRTMLGLGLAATIVLLGGGNATFSANPPSALDNPPSGLVPDVSIGPGDLVPQRAIGRERAPSGNPLWAIPLSALSATRERPIFRPSRRAPAPAVVGQPRVEQPAPVGPSRPERPQLTLVGAVIGEAEGIAVFLDTNNTVIRLRTGQDYSGWVLNILKAREATLQKDYETAVFTLPIPNPEGAPAAGEPLPAGSPAAAPDGAIVIPSAPGEFAPFVPRKTPKGGEHDGL